MAIVLSVLCALVYGSADFCGGLASRRTAMLGVVVFSQAAGFAVLLFAIPVFGGMPHASDIEYGVVCGIAGAIAIGLLYRGLAIGTMGVVSPITAVLAAVVPVLFGVFARGERPTPLTIAGIVASLVAVVCVSAAPRTVAAAAGDGVDACAQRALPPGVTEALGAGIGFGLFFVALAQTRPEAGMVPLLSARFTSVLLLVAAGLATRRARDLRIARPAIALVIVCGVLDMSANVLYVLAAHSGMLAIVAVLSSLYPAATVALAAIVVHERLVRVQWIGVAIALGGVTAISAAH